ncbi:SDR family oxidoreductase [Micromonospora sp. NBC_01796]|uniref:SDR family oxidoreductase n=1 Tax=Micromonospora sp. NBC_01796 TaxID=2975987 RepID=UPI002DD9B2A4|nr:SDR family oxidoreductase [Micromonospora sp. NBC_01796]WSA84664.1 SDR family oxidoreductase [Micromonospora sp. NBC_01796]
MGARTFVVAGGTSGLGLEVARKLTTDHRVFVLGNVADEVAATTSELECAGATCDVSSYDQVAHALDEVTRRYGALDGLAHCASMWAGGSLEEMSPEALRTVIDVNVLGTAYLLREALIRMRERGRGNIVYIGAMAVDKPRPGIPVYRAGKNFGKSLVESLAQAEGSDGIKVMQIHPGPMHTRLQERVGAEFLDEIYAEPEQVAREVVRLLLLEPDELYLSGQEVLRADGRW